MNEVNALDRLNKMVMYQTKGLPHRNRARLYIISRMAGLPVKINSSADLSHDELENILNYWYPDWRNPNAAPPPDPQKHRLHAIAVEVSQQLVMVLGTPEEWHAKLQAEEERRIAEKAARKARNKKHQKRIFEI